jgi:dihydrofolate reductase
LATRLYLTHVDTSVSGDTFFPEFDQENWLLEEIGRFEIDGKNEHKFRIVKYDLVES